MNGHYEIGDYVLTNWKLVKLLGAGAYGKVYEAEREEFGETYKAAIKIMTIPQADNEIKSVMSEGMTEEEVTDYFQGVVKQIISECKFMNKVKGVTNIVGYEDHAVVPHEGKLGWDVIIRMELLTPLLDHVIAQPLSIRDVVKLGIDVCRALEVCKKMNIIHRDVKPENVMVSALGDYKLGDFGISRTMEKTQGGLSKKGTASYMAPEVSKGEAYGHTVDTYSLGIMLYRFLNENRGPFLPAPPKPVSFSDRESALERRIGGEALPMPSQADAELGRIVLKACAYRPEDRYDAPEQMREELEAWLRERKNEDRVLPNGKETSEFMGGVTEKPLEYDLEKTSIVLPVAETEKQMAEAPKPVAEVPKPMAEAPKPVTETPKPVTEAMPALDPEITPIREPEWNAEIPKKTKGGKKGWILGIVAAVLALVAIGIFVLPRLQGDDSKKKEDEMVFSSWNAAMTSAIANSSSEIDSVNCSGCTINISSNAISASSWNGVDDKAVNFIVEWFMLLSNLDSGGYRFSEKMQSKAGKDVSHVEISVDYSSWEVKMTVYNKTPESYSFKIPSRK